MKRSDLRKAAALAVTLGFLLPACGFFSVKNDVSVKRVGVDLVFGAQSLSPQPSFSGGATFPTFAPPTLTTPPQPTFSPEPPEELCPPTTALGAELETVPRPTFDDDPKTHDHVPEINDNTSEGVYLNAFDGNLTGQRTAQSGANNLVIHNFQLQAGFTPQSQLGFQFSLRDEFNGVDMEFYVNPGTEDEQTDEGGLYLKSITIPTKGPLEKGVEYLSFITPAPHVKLLDWEVTPGATLSSSAGDVASKRVVPFDDPTGAVNQVPLPSANSITSSTTVGKGENIPICATIGQGYQTTWDLKITGEFNVRLVGTFWLATQYGGWPIKSDYIMFGDLVGGAFSNHLMRLHPEV